MDWGSGFFSSTGKGTTAPSGGGGFDWGQFGMNMMDKMPGLLGGGGQQTLQPPAPFDPGAWSRLAAENNFGGDPLGTTIKQSDTRKPEARNFSDRIEGFFGGVDDTLNSKGKLLGLGLLGQINPNLAYAGLLAAGLMGARRGKSTE